MAARTWFTITEINTLENLIEDDTVLTFDTREEAQERFDELTKKEQKSYTISENKANVPDEQ